MNWRLKVAQWLRKKVAKLEAKGIRNVDKAMGQTFPLRSSLTSVVGGPRDDKWHNILVVYDDGMDVCIWAYHGKDIRKRLASRLSSRPGTWYLEPDKSVPDQLIALQTRCYEMFEKGRISYMEYRQQIGNIEQARSEILTRNLQEKVV